MGASTAFDSSASRTESRNPSAAAMINLLPSIISNTPVNTGRASSVEAENTTCRMISFKSFTLNSAPPFNSGWGMGGNSWASIHFISVLEGPLFTFKFWDWVFKDIST